MKHLVIDSSALCAWLLPDEASAVVDRVMLDLLAGEVTATVPILAQWEVRNTVISARRQNRIDDERAAGLFDTFEQVPLGLDMVPNAHRLSQTVRLAITHGLTSYDAAYLELVLRLNVTLLSLDRAMVRAAKACGITCIDTSQ